MKNIRTDEMRIAEDALNTKKLIFLKVLNEMKCKFRSKDKSDNK